MWITSITTQVGRWELQGQFFTQDNHEGVSLHRVLAVRGEEVHVLAAPVFPAQNDPKATHVYAQTTTGWLFMARKEDK